MRRAPAIVLGASGALASLVGLSPACNDEALGREGDRCVLHSDCQSSICAAEACVAQGIDSDSDDLINADELLAGSDPLNGDSDGDGLNDGVEVGASPALPVDTDGDGNPDYRESNVLDRDLDGEPDQVDPTNDIPELDVGRACVAAPDCGDGICVGGQCYDGSRDLDQDGVNNADERIVGTNPVNPDTDADGDKDGEEVGDDRAHALDEDGDGRIDAIESSRVDSDGDGTPDQKDPL